MHELGGFIQELSKLAVGLIRACFNIGGMNALYMDSSGSRFFQLIIPISKLLRSILDRATRMPELISQDFWHAEFPISDYNVLKRRNMLRIVLYFQLLHPMRLFCIGAFLCICFVYIFFRFQIFSCLFCIFLNFYFE